MTESINPFVPEPIATAIEKAVFSLFGLMSLFDRVDSELAQQAAAAVGINMTGFGGDPITGLHALLWATSRAVHYGASLAPGIEFPVQQCEHTECHEIHQYEKAFLEASRDDQTQSAMNVVKALVKRCRERAEDPVEEMLYFFVKIAAGITTAQMQHAVDQLELGLLGDTDHPNGG